MTSDLRIEPLLHAYRAGVTTPREIIKDVWSRAGELDPTIWISRPEWATIESLLQKLESQDPEDLPLYGIPFAIKDNIDWGGQPTTAACPDFSYLPEDSAFVVKLLISAGAIPLGKTNLDQFATGLVGVRSPYGTPQNAFDPAYIPGGSSSGSAVAVARGLVSFALGTDTAGSGRIPASFNNLVGMKPTRGVLSCRGVLPACRTLDCVSIFALSVEDAMKVYEVAAKFDAGDAFARPLEIKVPKPLSQAVIGVPRAEQLEFFGDDSAAELFAKSVASLKQQGWQVKEIDLQPFLDAALLLYEGPWVAERYAGIQTFIETRPESLHPVTRQIISGGIKPTAVQAFKSQYRLAELRRVSEQVWEEVDAIITPTAGTIYKVAEVDADPIKLNSNLGRYTNYMNLLDLCAWAVPAGFLDQGLPWGVTFFAPAFQDEFLASLAAEFHAVQALPLGRTETRSDEIGELKLPSNKSIAWMQVVVCGAHMEGLPLNHQLTSRGGALVKKTQSSASYKLYVLPSKPGQPMRPGMVRVPEGGEAIDLEVWKLPQTEVGSFLEAIPAPLGLGKVELKDGSQVCGFVCEGIAAQGAEDITAFGGWRAWLGR
jgi:allophanate hydrolase